MRNSFLVLAAVCVAGTTMVVGLVKLDASPTYDPAPVQAKAPDGWVLVREEDWARLGEEPGHQLKRAHESFIKRDAKTAAAEIRKASAYLRASGGHATHESRDVLATAVQELELVAHRVQTGTVASVEELESACARAQHALARHHYVKASEAWTKGQARRAGLYLKSSATHLEHSAFWAGHQLEHAGSAALKESHIISAKMSEGAHVAVDDVGKGLTLFGAELERMGSRIHAQRR